MYHVNIIRHRSFFIALITGVLFVGCKKTVTSNTNTNSNSTGNDTSSVVVSTVAGSSDLSAFRGAPHGICIDDQGNIFFTTDAHVILKIDPLGLVSTFAGSGDNGCDDGTGDGATFTQPGDLALTTNNDMFVVDRNCEGLRMISAATHVSLYCKNGSSEGVALNSPYAIAADATGNAYVGGTGEDGITVVNTQAKGSHFAGNGVRGDVDGPVLSAGFYAITGICVSDNNDIYVADGAAIRLISQGQVSTIAGGNKIGYVDGQGSSARFGGSMGICLDSHGNLFVADVYNEVIRKVTPGGLVTTVAGTPGVFGYKDGPGNQAQFSGPLHLCFDRSGNLYVTDAGQGGSLDGLGYIRKIKFK